MLLTKVTVNCFCGFPVHYEVKLDQFTVLVGPNNGGKTTILRAIKFALVAFRLMVGDNPEGFCDGGERPWSVSLNKVGKQLGIFDLNQLYYVQSRIAQPSVTLVFNMSRDEVVLEVVCGLGNTLSLNLTGKGAPMKSPRDINARVAVNEIYKIQAELLPPLGTLTPVEKDLSWPQLEEELAQGRYAETWRNQLYWLNNDKHPELIQQVSRDIQEYLGDVQLRPPTRSREHTPPHIIVQYNEESVDYDISAAGGGLRTMVSLSTVIELSPASLLLFDEPDAHLHSSLQRKVANFMQERTTSGKQIIISTHAPDFIDEVPIDSLRWIDRKTTKGESCDDVGKTLVRLGAVSSSQAIQSLGADVVLYFEGAPDRTSLTALMKRCGKEALADRARPALLKGFGEIENLPGALRVLKALLPMKVAVVAIRDADYTAIDHEVKIDDKDDFLLLTLPCKELENLLLLDSKTITTAAEKAAIERRSRTDEASPSPSSEEVERKINELTKLDDVKDALEDQWKFRYLKSKGELKDASQVKEASQEFQKRWEDAEWRKRCCPGKLVLTHIRQWLQADPYKLTLSNSRLFQALEPDEKLQELFDTLEAYVQRVTT